MPEVLRNITKEEISRNKFIPIDEWVPKEEEKIYRHKKDVFIAPISKYFGLTEPDEMLESFSLVRKKSYKSEATKDHICKYLNYFERYYDQDLELLSVYANFKAIIDGYREIYNINALKFDLERYILSESMRWKVRCMTNDNYIPLRKNYRNNKNPSLQYNDEHCKLMFELSILQNMMIPILLHYAETNKEFIDMPINEFLIRMFDILFYMKSNTINLRAKFFETINSNTEHSTITNPIWNADKQDIRGINVSTFSSDTLDSFILQLMPKYYFNSAPVALNYSSIKSGIDHQVIGNEYEYIFVKLDTMKKDEDSNSEYDKFETYTAKQDESAYILLMHMAKKAMESIEREYGPFDQDEIDYYKNVLFSDTDAINGFQKKLISGLFFKEFGDPQALQCINRDDYIKLVIAARKKLEGNKMISLAYVISSKMVKSVSRSRINQKEEKKICESEIFQEIMAKYSYDIKIKQDMLSIIATIFSSTFKIISYNNEVDGKELNLYMDILSKEVCDYMLLC